MKPRIRRYSASVRQRIQRGLQMHDTGVEHQECLRIPNENRGMVPILHVRLFSKGGICKVPEGAEYLILISYDLDSTGNWVPIRAVSILNYEELRATLCHFAKSSGTLVISGGSEFTRLAQDLGLRLLNAEWGAV